MPGGGTASATSLFVGRDSELRMLLDAWTRVAAGEPVIVVVDGPAGIGKTTLLRRFAAEAGGVLAASGAEAEQLLPFGLVDQLLIRGGRPRVDSDGSVDPLAVGAQLLDLVASLESDRSAVVIDDLQWVDGPSLQALTFAIRRLAAEPLLLVFGVRDDMLGGLPDGMRRVLTDPGVVHVELSGLDRPDLDELAALVGPGDLPTEAVDRLYDQTRGHPLYVLDLLRELPAHVLTGSSSEPLPAPRTYAARVVDRLAELPADAAALIRAASVLGARCRLQDAAELAGVASPAAAMDPLVRNGWLSASAPARELEFAHPLVRAAIYHDLPRDVVNDLHRRAAQFAPTRLEALQHRVAATTGVDVVLADELIAFASEEEERAAWGSATEALLAAAELHPDSAQREDCVMRAAECLMMAGQGGAAVRLLPQIESAAPSPRRDQLLGFVAMLTGDRATSRRLLEAAWHACTEPHHRAVAAKAAAQLSMVALNDGRAADAIEWAHRSLELGAPRASRGITRAVIATAYGERGAFEDGLSAVGELPSDLSEFDGEALGTALGRGVLHLFCGAPDRAVEDLSLADLVARRGVGPFSLRINALFHLADAEYRLGLWDRAVLHAELATSLGEDSNAFWTLGLAHAIAAAPAAGRGNWAAAEAHITAAEAAAQKHGDAATRFYVSVASARLALARDDPASAVAALETIFALESADGVGEPGVQPWQALYGEALVGAGRYDDAERVAKDLLTSARDRGNARATLAAHRIRGLAAAARRDRDEAAAAYEQALTYLRDGVEASLQESLLHLDYGCLLRRGGSKSTAVHHLTHARRGLTALGATPFLVRCERELAAASGGGSAVVPTAANPRERLTSQELAVATLVAAGLRNRDVANELVISVKTVEYHLRHVFDKLEVTSRTMLAKRLQETAA